MLGTTESWIAVAITGLALSLIDMSIKPLLQLLSLPITCLTFGIFYLVVNTAMLYLAAWLSNGMFNVALHLQLRQRVFRFHRHQHRVRHHELHRRGQLGKRVRARHDAPGRGSGNYPAAPIIVQASQTRCCPSKL